VLRLGAASVIQAPVKRRLGGSWHFRARRLKGPSPVSYGYRYPGFRTPIEQTVRVPGSRQGKGEAADGIP